MSQQPDIEESISNPNPGHDTASAAVARSYFYLFFIYCGVIAYLEKPMLTWWFLGVLIVGAFAVPLLIVAPLMYLKKILAAKGTLRPQNAEAKYHHRLIDLAGAVVLWFVTWGAISAFGIAS